MMKVWLTYDDIDAVSTCAVTRSCTFHEIFFYKYAAALVPPARSLEKAIPQVPGDQASPAGGELRIPYWRIGAISVRTHIHRAIKPANVRSIIRENIDLKATPIRFAYVARFFPISLLRGYIGATCYPPNWTSDAAVLEWSWATRQFELRPIVSLRCPLTRTAARLLTVIFSLNRISCS